MLLVIIIVVIRILIMMMIIIINIIIIKADILLSLLERTREERLLWETKLKFCSTS